jgi:hypothetical protein
MRERTTKDNTFPHWVALLSLGFALTLFFANTVPALRERDGLQEVEYELADLRQRYEDAIRANQLGVGQASEYDLQSLLVAIDRLGYTPTELCAAHPERLAETDDPDDPREPR